MNTPYAIYDLATGRIGRCGYGQPDDIQAMLQTGQGFLQGTYSPATHYVDQGQAVAFPARPSQDHVFDYGSKTWIDPRSFDDLKAEKWGQMKAARMTAITAPLVTPYGTFDADPESADNIIRTAQLMQTEAQSLAPGSTPTDDFTLADNSVVNLTAAEMVNVALLLASQIKAAFSRGREVRVAIDSATTTAELNSIAW